MSVATSLASGQNQVGNARSIVTEVTSDQRERMLASHSFRFRHALSGHSSMSLTEIRKLLDQMLAERRFNQIFYKTGVSMKNAKHSDPESAADLNKVLDNLNSAGVWL